MGCSRCPGWFKTLMVQDFVLDPINAVFRLLYPAMVMFTFPAVLLLQKLDQVGLPKAASGEATERKLKVLSNKSYSFIL